VVNLDDAVVTELQTLIETDSISPNVFAKARKFCFDLMESGSFPRFMKSSHFLSVLHRYLTPSLRRHIPIALIQGIKAQGISVRPPDWRPLGRRKGVEMFCKALELSRNSKLFYTAAFIPLACAAEKAIRLLLSLSDERKNWDDFCTAATVIERVGEQMQIVHRTYILGSGLFGKTKLEDSVMLEGWHAFEDGSWVAVSLDVQHDQVPPLKTHTRRQVGSYSFCILPSGADTSNALVLVQTPHRMPKEAEYPDKESERLDPAKFARLQKFIAKAVKDPQLIRDVRVGDLFARSEALRDRTVSSPMRSGRSGSLEDGRGSGPAPTDKH